MQNDVASYVDSLIHRNQQAQLEFDKAFEPPPAVIEKRTHRQTLMWLGVKSKKYLNDSIEDSVIREMSKYAKSGCYFLDDVVAEVLSQSFCKKIYPCVTLEFRAKGNALKDFNPTLIVVSGSASDKESSDAIAKFAMNESEGSEIRPDFAGLKTFVLKGVLKPNTDWQHIALSILGDMNVIYNDGEVVLREKQPEGNLLGCIYDRNRAKAYIRKNANRFLVKKKLYDSIQ
jgi:hypothetical protein